LDPDALAQLHPVYGVIFLFKYPTDKPYTSAEKPLDGSFDHDAAEQLFFATQTIQNACGTQALLSVLLNKTDAADTPEAPVEIGSGLQDFREFAMCVPPALRGEVLSNSELIRETHNSFARASPFVDETTRDPNAETEDAFHFIAYASLKGTLYELDGLQPAPISHGPCTQEEFPTKVMQVLQSRIARYEASEIRFNLLAVVRDLRIRARELGDVEMLEREEAKRREWQFENALRRHNFVSFSGEVLKGVVGMKVAEGKGAYDRWVGDATDKMRKRIEERSGRKAAAQAGAAQDVDMLG
jgi:ubiquitin carboxyl-terminal hydrolase L5